MWGRAKMVKSNFTRGGWGKRKLAGLKKGFGGRKVGVFERGGPIKRSNGGGSQIEKDSKR